MFLEQDLPEYESNPVEYVNKIHHWFIEDNAKQQRIDTKMRWISVR